MAHLNWRNSSLKQEIHAESGPVSRLELTLDAERLGELITSLGELLGGERELRVDLPQEWIVFWKLREGESRLLLAHPNVDEWVATMALERAHAEAAVERLKGVRDTGGSVELGELAREQGTLSGVSNVELVIARG